jgi:regulatory protein
MPDITDLLPDPGSQGRWIVLVDHVETARIGIEAVESLHLAVGMPVTGALRQSLELADAARRLLEGALSWLDSRPYSSGELRAGLAATGADPVAVDAALARLGTLQLIDDRAYAEGLLRGARAGESPEALAARLRRHLIDEALIAELIPASGDTETIDTVAADRLRTMRGVPPDAQRRRLAAYLARRGWSEEDVAGVLERLLRCDDEHGGVESA